MWILSKVYVNSLSLPAQVVESLGANSWDGVLCAPSSGNPTPPPSLSPDKTKGYLRLSRFGMTFKHSTELCGAVESMLSQVDSLAPTSAAQGREPVSTVKQAECGGTWPGSLARFDQSTRSWRTAQYSLLGDSIEYSGTWPRWGMMLSGVLWERTMSERLTSAIGSGYSVPTPVANPEAPNHKSNSKGPHNLLEVAQTGWKPGMTWLTPKSSDTGKGEGSETFVKRNADRGEHCFQSLPSQVMAWPTPLKNSGTGKGDHGQGGMNIQTAVHQWPTPQANKTTESGELVNSDGTPWDGKRKPHSKTTGRPVTSALADSVAHQWPTPKASEGSKGARSTEGALKEQERIGSVDLGSAVKLWPTPTVAEANKIGARANFGQVGLNNHPRIRGEPTREKKAKGDGGSETQQTQTMQLNPAWVGWLMGFPTGWVCLSAWVMPKSRMLPRWPGRFYLIESKAMEVATNE